MRTFQSVTRSAIGDTLCYGVPADVVAILKPMVEHILRDIVLPLAQQIDETDTGVVFAVFREGEFVTSFTAGRVPDGDKAKWVEYGCNALKKGYHVAREVGRTSSFQDADEGKDGIYGGAVEVAHIFVFAPSGLNSHFDEMLACLVAHAYGLMTIHEMRAIAHISENTYLRDYITNELEKNAA